LAATVGVMRRYGDVADCLRDLSKTIGGKSASSEEIGKWVDRWYQF